MPPRTANSVAAKKWALRAALLCGVLLLVALPLLLRHNSPPSIVIPPPQPLPNPNAFDFYVQAGTMIVPAPVAAYEKDAPLSLLQSTMQTNAPALRVLRKGFAFPYRQPAARGLAAGFPNYFGRFRETTRQLVMESRVLAARGDWSGAMQSRLDGVRFGSDIPRGGAMLSALVGIAMESLARKQAYLYEPHLTAPQARAAAKRLEQIIAQHPTLAESFTEEKWSGLQSMKDIFSQPGSRSQMGKKPLEKLQWYFLDPQQVANNYIASMDAQIANARLPYGTSAQPVPQPTDPYNRLMRTGSNADRFRFNFARNDTGNALLLANLALRAFREERGDFPQSLDELAPSYLKSVPLDPFGNGKTLRYRRIDKGGYWVYSVGPDGKDDGAHPVMRRGSPVAFGNLSSDLRGDIVLGLNP